MIECEVLVVGAGPTGLPMAVELRRRGVDCLVIDARTEPQAWIQDAVNLAWKLALISEGDADPALLDGYEAERRPVALEIVAAGEMMEDTGHCDGEEGRARRDEEVRAALSDPETAHSPLFDAAFVLVTARGDAPVGTIHPDAAAALGVKSLAVLAIRG